jgi:hypothetical protein
LEKHSLASILINLRGISITSAAKSTGLNTSAVAGWLKGVPGRLSQEKQNIFFEYLGISGGTLASDQVHRWTVNHNLDPLREILAWVGEDFEEIVLIPQNILVKDWFPTSNLFLLYSSSKSIRILLRQKISPLIPAGESSLVNPTNLPLLKWFDIPKGTGIVDKLTSNPLLRISRNLFDKFMSDASVSLEEFGQILELMRKIHPKGESPRKDSMTWEDFYREMERRGLRPKDVLAMLDVTNGRKSK